MKKRLNVTVDSEAERMLKQAAQKDHRSLSNLIEVIVIDYLKNREIKQRHRDRSNE